MNYLSFTFKLDEKKVSFKKYGSAWQKRVEFRTNRDKAQMGTRFIRIKLMKYYIPITLRRVHTF